MSRATFAELYCARHGLAPEAYVPAVFRCALYPHTRLVVSWLRLFDSDYFAADLDLVQAAGRLRVIEDFNLDAMEYRFHPANHGALRRMLRLRVSAGRLHALIRATLPAAPHSRPPAAGSAPPLARPTPAVSDQPPGDATFTRRRVPGEPGIAWRLQAGDCAKPCGGFHAHVTWPV